MTPSAGTLDEQPEPCESQELRLRLDSLGRCVHWGVSDDRGRLDLNVDSRDVADRESCRGTMAADAACRQFLADPAYPQFLERATALLDRMENKILRPAPYCTAPELEGQG